MAQERIEKKVGSQVSKLANDYLKVERAVADARDLIQKIADGDVSDGDRAAAQYWLDAFGGKNA